MPGTHFSSFLMYSDFGARRLVEVLGVMSKGNHNDHFFVGMISLMFLVLKRQTLLPAKEIQQGDSLTTLHQSTLLSTVLIVIEAV